MSRPTVTVLLSTYNGQKYLKEQMDSLLNQVNVDVRIVVRDDGSTDETLLVLENYSHLKNVSVYSGKNVGVRKSFIELLELADVDSDYYTFCDQDDVWLENKLEVAISKIVEYRQSKPAIYYSDVRRVGSDLEEIPDVFNKNYYTETFGAALISTAAAGCTMVWNHKLMEILLKYNPDYVYMHDNWVLLVCLAIGGSVYYDENSYILYRQHSQNVVGGVEKLRKNKLQLFIYRVKKFLDVSYNYKKTSEQLLDGYRQYMTEENTQCCELLIAANSKLGKRIELLLSKKIKTPYLIINMKFWYQVLICKL